MEISKQIEEIENRLYKLENIEKTIYIVYEEGIICSIFAFKYLAESYIKSRERPEWYNIEVYAVKDKL